MSRQSELAGGDAHNGIAKVLASTADSLRSRRRSIRCSTVTLRSRRELRARRPGFELAETERTEPAMALVVERASVVFEGRKGAAVMRLPTSRHHPTAPSSWHWGFGCGRRPCSMPWRVPRLSGRVSLDGRPIMGPGQIAAWSSRKIPSILAECAGQCRLRLEAARRRSSHARASGQRIAGAGGLEGFARARLRAFRRHCASVVGLARALAP